MSAKKNKPSRKPEVSKPEVSKPTSDIRPLTSECIAFTHGHHACNCGGAHCGSNVTS